MYSFQPGREKQTSHGCKVTWCAAVFLIMNIIIAAHSFHLTLPSSLFSSLLMFLSYACAFLASESQPKPTAAWRVCSGNYCARDLFWVEMDPPSGNEGGGALQLVAARNCKTLHPGWAFKLNFWLVSSVANLYISSDCSSGPKVWD